MYICIYIYIYHCLLYSLAEKRCVPKIFFFNCFFERQSGLSPVSFVASVRGTVLARFFCVMFIFCAILALLSFVCAFGILAWLLPFATLKSCDLAAFGVCDAVALGVLGSSASLCFRCTGPARCLYFHS